MGFGVSFSQVLALDKPLIPFTLKSVILALGCEPGTIKHVVFFFLSYEGSREHGKIQHQARHMLIAHESRSHHSYFYLA